MTTEPVVLAALYPVRRGVNKQAVLTDALARALRHIGYEPIGPADASTADVLQGCVDIARAALSAYDAAREGDK